MKLGIIGGTGFYTPGMLQYEAEQKVQTPFGQVNLLTGTLGGREVVFLTRHGMEHSVPPHLVNYRANIWALREIGAAKVVATAAVGSLNPEMHPGEMVLVDQFLDFTKNRCQTFFDGGDGGVLHVDMTEPYCPEFRKEIAGVAEKLDIPLHLKGTYVCTEGPRYETPAEIRMFRILGGDLVGMTSVPEVVLAREAGLCYATLALVTNYAAGISQHPLSHREVVEEMERSQTTLRRLIHRVVEEASEVRYCCCSGAAAELGSLGRKNP